MFTGSTKYQIGNQQKHGSSQFKSNIPMH